MSVKMNHCLAAGQIKDWSGVMQAGMYNLWKQQELCDVIVAAKNGTIKCHKLALAAHSSLMARMISEYAPDDVVRIRLPAYSMETVQTVLNYMYTSDAELSSDNVSHVISLAVKLGLTTILDACKTYLVKCSSSDNVILHYSIASNNSLQDTAQLLFNIIADNFCSVTKTTQFLYLNVERLLPIIQCSRLNIDNEMDVFKAVVNWVNFDRVSRVPEAKRLMDAIHFEDIFADDLIQETERSQWLLSECSPVRDIIFDVIRYQCKRTKTNFYPCETFHLGNMTESPIDLGCFPGPSCQYICADPGYCCTNNCVNICEDQPPEIKRACSTSPCLCSFKPRGSFDCGFCSCRSFGEGRKSSFSDRCSSPLRETIFNAPKTFLNRQYDQFKEISGASMSQFYSKSPNMFDARSEDGNHGNKTSGKTKPGKSSKNTLRIPSKHKLKKSRSSTSSKQSRRRSKSHKSVKRKSSRSSVRSRGHHSSSKMLARKSWSRSSLRGGSSRSSKYSNASLRRVPSSAYSSGASSSRRHKSRKTHRIPSKEKLQKHTKVSRVSSRGKLQNHTARSKRHRDKIPSKNKIFSKDKIPSKERLHRSSDDHRVPLKDKIRKHIKNHHLSNSSIHEHNKYVSPRHSHDRGRRYSSSVYSNSRSSSRNDVSTVPSSRNSLKGSGPGTPDSENKIPRTKTHRASSNLSVRSARKHRSSRNSKHKRKGSGNQRLIKHERHQTREKMFRESSSNMNNTSATISNSTLGSTSKKKPRVKPLNKKHNFFHNIPEVCVKHYRSSEALSKHSTDHNESAKPDPKCYDLFCNKHIEKINQKQPYKDTRQMSFPNDFAETVDNSGDAVTTHMKNIKELRHSPSDFMTYYNMTSHNAPYLLMIGGLDLHKVDSDVPGKFIMALSVSEMQRGRGLWIRVPLQLEQFLHHHQASIIHGKLYLIGGAIFNSERPNRLGVATDGVTIFNFRTGHWKLGSPMPAPRAYFGMARWHDRLIVVGGENDNTSETDVIDYYDTSTDSWGILTRHPGGPRLGVATAVLKNFLYVVGGYTETTKSRGEILSDAYCYNLMTGQWSSLSGLEQPISHATLVVLNNSTLILAGGRTVVKGQKGSSADDVMAYYEARNAWKKVGQLSIGRHDMASAVVKTDNSHSCVYLIGGMSNPSPAALKIVECLTFDEQLERANVVNASNTPYAVTGAACCVVK